MTEKDIDSAIKKYKSNLVVSRDMFNTVDLDIRPWRTPRPTPSEQIPVYDRLFQDFSRRQEAQKRLISIIDQKERANRQASLHIPNSTSRSLRRSLSKPEVNNLIERLNLHLQTKLQKIEKRRKELAEAQEIEYKELVKNKKMYKPDPVTFKRLTTPRFYPTPVQLKPERKKTFSIREAIESGKRLMVSGIRVLRDLESVTPSVSPMRKSRTEIWNTERNFSPRKSLKKVGTKQNIDEVFIRCKNKAMLMSFVGKKIGTGDEGVERDLMLRTLDSYRSLNSEKGTIFK